MKNKIIFAGPVGAGKTTAIKSVSDILVVGTEAQASDDVAQRKKTTTVAMDYGILNLDDGSKVHLYGTPGQERFSFMWEILSEGAMGVIILIDAGRSDPLADLEFYLEAFRGVIAKCDNTAMIGVTRAELASQTHWLDRFNDKLATMQMNIPIFEVDGRQRKDVKQLLLALLAFLDPSTNRGRR